MVDLASLLPVGTFNPQEIWKGLQRWPAGLGNRAVDLFAKVYVPHAARMGFHLEVLDERHIEASMPDRRRNRNHLDSLHAMALAHLGEFTCGVLLLYAVAPKGYRTILRKYEIEYLAKARGRVTGRSTLKLPRGELDKKDVVVKA
ncbi:MAG TPA: DUF4442 domain-containing protein, partial [bacterium]|nr:DUF4442 domain-containing protein [bacterium]